MTEDINWDDYFPDTIVSPASVPPEHEPVPTLPPRPRPIPLTREDSHNSEYFEYEFGKTVRYDHPTGRWFIWHKGTHRWKEDDNEYVMHLAELAAKRRANDCVNANDTAKLKIAMSLLSLARRKAALENLRSQPGIAVGQHFWNQNPDVFVCANGVVELRTGLARPGCPEDNATKASPVRYDIQASCPRWMTFLKEVFVTDEMVEYVRTIVGYCMTGRTTEQVWFLLYGTGGNGKSVFVSVLEAIFGVKQYYEQAAAETFIATRFGSSASHNIAQLRHARLVVASEVPERASFDGARIKQLTGSDPVTAAAKYENNVTFVPQLKLMMLVNHLPATRDDSQGFWRRLRPIPFDVSFTDAGTADPNLVDTLMTELPGILNWAISGAVTWYESGLAPEPSSASQLKDDYRTESDPLAMFIHECVIETRSLADTVAAREVYRIYLAWCVQSRHPAMSETNLARAHAMQNLGLGKKKTTPGMVYVGIKVFEPGAHPVSLGSNSPRHDVDD